MSLFEKTEQTEANVAGVVKTPEEKPDDTETKVKESLQKSVDAATEYLPLMVSKAIACELALSKIVAINNDADDEIAEKLLVKNRNTYNDVIKMREEITKPIDAIKELAMRPEKRISILANQPTSTFNRVKGLRDAYANQKLAKQKAEIAAANKKKNAGEEIIRLKGVFENRFHSNVVDLLTDMENNIVKFFQSLTVEDFDEKIKKFDIKPKIKAEVFESWFTVDYNKDFLTDVEFKEFVDMVRGAYTYEGINAIYVEQAEAKLAEWKLKLPAKKQELIDMAELEKTNKAEADKLKAELEQKAIAEQAKRTEAADATKNEKAAEVQTAQRTAQLDNEFDHLKVVQNQEQIKGAITKRIATLDCDPKQIVEVISKAIYTLFTVPVPNPTFHLKRDKSGVIMPPDEHGRPVYDSWLEDILTKFASTGVKMEGIRIDERLGTVQKSK